MGGFSRRSRTARVLLTKLLGDRDDTRSDTTFMVRVHARKRERAYSGLVDSREERKECVRRILSVEE